MATLIKFIVGQDEMVVPSLSFGLNSYADVTNPTQEIDFQPVSVSEFSFSILTPTEKTKEMLVKWIVEHETKDAKFTVNKQALKESAREITMTEVCLTSYSESIDENYSSISLSVVSRKVSVSGMDIDLSQNR